MNPMLAWNHTPARNRLFSRAIARQLTLLVCLCITSQAHATREEWRNNFSSYAPDQAVPTCDRCHDKIAAGEGQLVLNGKDDVSRSATEVTIESPMAGGVGSSWRYRDPTTGVEEYLPRTGATSSGPRVPQTADIAFPIGTESKTIEYCAGQREPFDASAAIFRCGTFEIKRRAAPNETPDITQPNSTLSIEVDVGDTETINVTVNDDNNNELDYRWEWNNTNATVSPATLNNTGNSKNFKFTGVSVGTTNFTLTVTDPSGASDSVSVVVDVEELEENTGPTITSPADGIDIAFTNGVGRNFFVDVSDDSREIEFYNVTNYDAEVVDVFEVSPGFYILSALANGSSIISFTVVDVDGLSATSTICVSARNLSTTAPSVVSRPSTVCNDFPQFISASPSDSFQLEPGDVISASLEILDDDPDSHIRRMSVEDPSVVQVDDGAGDDISIQAVGLGTSLINVTIEDGAGQVLEIPLSVEVADEVMPNSPPKITSHAPSGTINLLEGGSQQVNLTVVDAEDDPVSLAASSNDTAVVEVTETTSNSVFISARGIGAATISVTPSDADAGPKYTFDVQVDLENDAPTASDDFYVFTFETPTQSLSVLDNDFDPNQDVLSIELDSGTTDLGGSIVEDGGVVVYTPPGVFDSTDQFEYKAVDSRGASSSLSTVEIAPSDVDGDGIFDGFDNCVLQPNSSQIDSDNDGAGDVCDPTPLPGGDLLVPGSGEALVIAECLTCHETGESGAPLFGDDAAWQARIDAAGGDISELVNSVIFGLGAMPSFGQRFTAAELSAAVLYLTGREIPPITEVPDEDSDSIADAEDNCVFYSNTDQADVNNNGVGDVCETDTNGDGVLDYSLSFLTSQAESDDSRRGGLISRSGGPVSIRVRTRSDLTGLTYDWSKSHPLLLDIATFADDGATMQFAPENLQPAQRDAVVVVSGNGVTARGRTRLMILNGAVGEDFADADQDGYPASIDSDDSNPRRLLANPLAPTNTLSAETSQALAIGDVAAVSAAIGGYTSATIQLDDAAFLAAAALRYNDVEPIVVPNLNSASQNINLEIRELNADMGSVVMRLPGNLPLNPQLRIYKAKQAQWETLSTADGDSLASAPLVAGACPIASSPNFQTVLTAGFGCVRLSVKDGGANDLDERRDGVVTLLINIGSSIDPTDPTDPPTGPPNPDVIINSGSGGGSFSAMTLWVLLALLRWRRRSWAYCDLCCSSNECANTLIGKQLK